MLLKKYLGFQYLVFVFGIWLIQWIDYLIPSQLVWAEIEYTVHFLCPKWPVSQLKSVQQNKPQLLRAYCPNLYTVHSPDIFKHHDSDIFHCNFSIRNELKKFLKYIPFFFSPRKIKILGACLLGQSSPILVDPLVQSLSIM